MRIRSAISTDMQGVQWRKLDVELEESDWPTVASEAKLGDPAAVPISAKFNAMRKKADSLLIFWMLKEGLLTQEQAVLQLKEIANN